MVDLVSRFEGGVSGALLLSIIAFSTVFIVLVGLTFVIYCVRFLAVFRKGADQGDRSLTPTPAPQVPPVPVPTQQPQAPQEEGAAEEELVAVIAAAIAASTGAEAPRVTVAPAAVNKLNLWRAAARAEQMEGLED